MLMKKILAILSTVGLLLPAVALAAYNDVSLTTDTVLSVGGVTVNVSGSAATIESISADSSTFTVNVQPGSNFTVTAPNGNVLNYSTTPNEPVTKTWWAER